MALFTVLGIYIILPFPYRREMESMNSPVVKGVAISTISNETYGQGQGKQEEKIPQHEAVCSPTASSPVT